MFERFKAWVKGDDGVEKDVPVSVVSKTSTALVVAGTAGAGVFATAGTALAGVDFTDVTISTADIFTFTGIILAAIGAIWGIKKLIGLGNKS